MENMVMKKIYDSGSLCDICLFKEKKNVMQRYRRYTVLCVGEPACLFYMYIIAIIPFYEAKLFNIKLIYRYSFHFTFSYMFNICAVQEK